MLLELAVGDAYGAGFECVRDPGFVKRNNDLTRYVKHPRHPIKPGCYTDDTQMSLAIAELVLEEETWTPESIAARFVDCFHRDRRAGYSGRFFKFLKSVRSGKEFLEAIDPRSDKSGAAMRAAPIGLYADLDEVIERCTLQAQVTHDTRDGIDAAVAVSVAVHYLVHDRGPRVDLPDFLQAHVPRDWSAPWTGEVGSKGWMSVRAALTSFLMHDSLSSMLRSAVAWTGDVDTSACLAMALGSVSKEVEQDLPDCLVRQLENKDFGRDYLKRIDGQLLER